MPGHKGKSYLGVEEFDITEIEGADSLYEANGIIEESELIASEIFGAKTYYSTEGASHAIRAMVFICEQYAKQIGRKPLILAGRNAHKSFTSAVALTGVSVRWLFCERSDGYLSCNITAKKVENAILSESERPIAVYLTSPDYLGNTLDIEEISKVCKKYGVLLVVDNAHGAYLKFLEKSLYPTDLGADMCSSSAHKTLPVLTGGAYLHISHEFFSKLQINPKTALSLFGSTSPSYLIMSSLDNANLVLASGFSKKLQEIVLKINDLKQKLTNNGYVLSGDEPLKVTIKTKSYGYLGTEICQILRKNGVECEFCDPDFVVMMFAIDNGVDGIKKVEEILLKIERKKTINDQSPSIVIPQIKMGIREAIFSLSEVVAVENCEGKILAKPEFSCPPAVPILACGEVIDQNIIKVLKYYGIKNCTVVK